MRALLWSSLVVLVLFGIGFFFYTIFFASLEPVAREAFSAAHSCPEQRMTSRERPDLGAYDMTFGTGAPAEAPAEVKADPARLAVWEETQRQDRERRASWNEAGQVVEVEGCERSELYVCYRSNYSNGGDGWPFCTPVLPHLRPAGAR